MEPFYFLPLVSIGVGLLAAWLLNGRDARINVAEFITLVVLTSSLGFGAGQLSHDSQFSASEWVSGKFTSLYPEDGPCHHCHDECITYDSKGKCTSSHEVCDHSADRVWYAVTDYSKHVPGTGVFTFSGNGIGIGPRGLTQGTDPPQEWKNIRLGQPAAERHTFKSFLKPDGESDSFPTPTSIEPLYRKFVPPQSTEFLDGYFHAYRVFALGYPTNNIPAGFSKREFDGVDGRWATDTALNTKLDALNAELGPKKQANVQLYRVNAQAIPDPLFADLALSVWRGGGKNDIDVFIGTVGDKIEWVRIMLGATDEGNKLFVIHLRDALLDQQVINNDAVLNTVKYWTLNSFNRKAMKDFEYREAGIHPPTWMVLLVYALAFIISCIGAFIALATDIFGRD
jgi:hypothetical protein